MGRPRNRQQRLQVVTLSAMTESTDRPKAKSLRPLRALVFDSYYDAYRGVIVFIRVVDGELRKGDRIQFSASGAKYEALEVGVLTPGVGPV